MPDVKFCDLVDQLDWPNAQPNPFVPILLLPVGDAQPKAKKTTHECAGVLTDDCHLHEHSLYIIFL